MESYHIREICPHIIGDFASCKYKERFDKFIQVTSYGTSSNRVNSEVFNFGEYAAVEGGGVNRIRKIPILPRDGAVRWRKSGGGVESR
jgi:hypothetical protein